MLLTDLKKLIQVAEAAVPISALHLDSIKDITSTLAKIREVKANFIKLQSLCEPLKHILLVSRLPLIKEVLLTIDNINIILRSIDL